ncbi:unnamed protein product, partial [marine sediment metagenome]
MIFVLWMTRTSKWERRMKEMSMKLQIRKRPMDVKKIFAVGLLAMGLLFAFSLVITTILGVEPLKIGYALMVLVVGGMVFLAYKVMFAYEHLTFAGDRRRVITTI